jgi:hypothetical protein
VKSTFQSLIHNIIMVIHGHSQKSRDNAHIQGWTDELTVTVTTNLPLLASRIRARSEKSLSSWYGSRAPRCERFLWPPKELQQKNEYDSQREWLVLRKPRN